MARTERVYSRVSEAEDLMNKLCEAHPEVLWQVKPANVAIYGIENQERNEKNKTLAKVKPIKGLEKTIMQQHNVPIRWVIEIYWSDWHSWSPSLKQWIVFHELLHVSHEIGKTVRHDSEDFRIVLDVVGVDWVQKGDGLPNLLHDSVEFNLDLLPGIEDADPDDIDIDQRKKNAEAKSKDASQTKADQTEAYVKEVPTVPTVSDEEEAERKELEAEEEPPSEEEQLEAEELALKLAEESDDGSDKEYDSDGEDLF